MTSKSGPGRLNERAFAKLVRDRLMDTGQVGEMLGLTVGGVEGRIRLGHLSGPVIVKERGYSLWDRVQVEREAEAMAARTAT